MLINAWKCFVVSIILCCSYSQCNIVGVLAMYIIILCVVLYPGPMSEWNTNALVKLKGELKLNIKMIKLIDILQTPAGGFMDSAEVQSVKALIGDAQQIEQVIGILLGKGNKEFTIFCQLLRRSNYQGWAHQLELEAEKFKTNVGMKHHLLHSCMLLKGVAGHPYIIFILGIWDWVIWLHAMKRICQSYCIR